MSILLPQFKKYIWLDIWCKKEWENRFLTLSDLQQKALLDLLQYGVKVIFAYDAIIDIDVNDLLLRYDETINNISDEYLSRSAW